VNLIDLLAEQRVLVPLSAKTLAEALQALAQACVADGKVTDPERLATAIRETSPADTVSMGPHAFLSHFRTDAVPEVVVALGIAGSPVRREPRSSRKARIVLLVVAPPGEAARSLQAVGAFARVLAQPEIATSLLEARSPADVLQNPGLRAVPYEGPLMARDLMRTPALTVGPDVSLGEAAVLMLQQELEELPVVGERGEVVGLLSHAELLRHLVPAFLQRRTRGEAATRKRGSTRIATDPWLVPVREVMARNVLCLSDDQSVAEAAALMASKRLEGLPVVRDGVLIGLLTRSDIVRRVVGGIEGLKE
jgi:CBS domain-containing protein